MEHKKKEQNFELEELNNSRLNDIILLEETSMKTNTTFPLTNQELSELFENGYIAYGYENNNGELIAKVGFEKVSDKKYELDVCVHPSLQGKGHPERPMARAVAGGRRHCPRQGCCRLRPR